LEAIELRFEIPYGSGVFCVGVEVLHFVRIGARSIGWVEEEIDRYVESKIATRDRDAAHRQEQDR